MPGNKWHQAGFLTESRSWLCLGLVSRLPWLLEQWAISSNLYLLPLCSGAPCVTSRNPGFLTCKMGLYLAGGGVRPEHVKHLASGDTVTLGLTCSLGCSLSLQRELEDQEESCSLGSQACRAGSRTLFSLDTNGMSGLGAWVFPPENQCTHYP